MAEEYTEKRAGYDKLLSDVGEIRGMLPGIQHAVSETQEAVSKIFDKLDRQNDRFEKLNSEFVVCRGNSDAVTEKAEQKIRDIEKAVANNYQSLSVAIDNLKPASGKLNPVDKWRLRNEKIKFFLGIGGVAGILIVVIASLSIWAYQKNLIDRVGLDIKLNESMTNSRGANQ